MTIRQLRVAVLITVLSSFLAPSLNAQAESVPSSAQSSDLSSGDSSSGLSKRDPFLESIMKGLQDRRANPEGLKKLSAFISEHPNDADAHLVLARAYMTLGMDSMYVEEIEKAWRLSPNQITFLLVALRSRSVAHDSAGFESLAEEAFKTYHDNAKKLVLLAKSFQGSDQPELALKFFQRAHQLDPQVHKILSSYCAALLAKKQYAAVLIEVKPLLADKESSAFAELMSGIALYHLNAPEKALPLLQKACAANPTQADVAEAYFDVLLALGKRQEALKPGLVALAMQLPMSERFDELKKKILPVVLVASAANLKDGIDYVASLHPSTMQLAYFYFGLGDLLDKSGKIVSAIECYANGLKIDEGFGRGYMRLAHDLELLGRDPDQILSFYEKAASYTPSDPEVVSRCERMTTRVRASGKDIAGRMKGVLNSFRYQQASR